MLQAVCSVGVISQGDAGRSELTQLGATLRNGAPDSARTGAEFRVPREAAGRNHARTIVTEGEYSIIKALPA